MRNDFYAELPDSVIDSLDSEIADRLDGLFDVLDEAPYEGVLDASYDDGEGLFGH